MIAGLFQRADHLGDASLTPGRIWRGAGAIGEDTTDILSGLLGLSATEIDRLYADEVVHRTEPFTAAQVGAVHP